MSGWRTIAAVLCAAGAAACAASLPPPSLEDAARARERWPEATLADLDTGRALYVRRCAGCHHLPDPRKHTEAQWAEITPKMYEKARLDPEQSGILTRYLVVMAAAPGPSAP